MIGQVALVTGGSGGIGAALATRLAAAGADVALTYGAHREPAEEVAEQVHAAGRRALVLGADLTDPAAPGRLVAETRAQLGDPGIVVANAGLAVIEGWRDVGVEDWDRTFAVNTRAPFLLAQAALPAMIERGYGRILFVSSVAAHTGGVVGPHYAASKAALHGLMHHLAPRVAKHGVTVNAIAPALVARTRMLPVDPEDTDAVDVSIPVGRFGTPEEVADLALAMLRVGYLTDKVITVDGGIYPSS